MQRSSRRGQRKQGAMNIHRALGKRSFHAASSLASPRAAWVAPEDQARSFTDTGEDHSAPGGAVRGKDPRVVPGERRPVLGSSCSFSGPRRLRSFYLGASGLVKSRVRARSPDARASFYFLAPGRGFKCKFRPRRTTDSKNPVR